MILSIIILILFIAFFVLSFARYIGRNGTVLLILIPNLLMLTFILFNVINFSSCLFSSILFIPFSQNFTIFYFEWGFFLDSLSLLFLFIIVFITTAVLFFASSYMYTDVRFCFFISFLQFFMFFMLLLVLSDNLVQLFVGWEGVGVISFILINFWYLRLEANKGALKALVFNRIGDFGYVAFLIFFLVFFKNTSLTLISYFFNEQIANISFFNVITLFLLLAVFGKSAQLFLYAWLPDAMEGPTPVSSLLHSATMVTAGVYLLLRTISFVFYSSTLILYFVIIASGLTSIMCGLYALTKFDIKKIIAFSTCSQLGLMVCAIAFGFGTGAFYHLYIHAFFKALLFISSGIIIHSLANDQDIRKYGSTSILLPIFYLILGLGSLNIMGIFFFSGFYSKEFLLLGISSNILATFFKSFVFISSLFTVLYSIRLFFYNTTKLPLTARSVINNIHSMDILIVTAVLFLALPSVFMGFLVADSVIGFGLSFLYTLNVPTNFFTIELSPSSLSFLFFILSLIFLIIGNTISNFFKFSYRYLYFKFVIVYNVLQELQIQTFYWSINLIFSRLMYSYVVKIFERSILDSLSFYGFLKLGLNFITNEKNYFVGNLLSFFFIVYVISTIFVFFVFFRCFDFSLLSFLGLLFIANLVFSKPKININKVRKDKHNG